jgi:hypothetical protein
MDPNGRAGLYAGRPSQFLPGKRMVLFLEDPLHLSGKPIVLFLEDSLRQGTGCGMLLAFSIRQPCLASTQKQQCSSLHVRRYLVNAVAFDALLNGLPVGGYRAIRVSSHAPRHEYWSVLVERRSVLHPGLRVSAASFPFVARTSAFRSPSVLIGQITPQLSPPQIASGPADSRPGYQVPPQPAVGRRLRVDSPFRRCSPAQRP